MSIIVRNMEMPKRCFDCPCCWAVRHFECLLAKKDLRKEHGINISRPNWCPLTEIPPHGRLIDADKIDYCNDAMHNGTGHLVVADNFMNGVLWINDCIDNAPTVIEAEGET